MTTQKSGLESNSPTPLTTTTEELTELFNAQKAAFARNMYPSYKYRIDALNTLESMVRRYRKKIEQALAEDFRSHPAQLTAICELMGPISRANLPAPT